VVHDARLPLTIIIIMHEPFYLGVSLIINHQRVYH